MLSPSSSQATEADLEHFYQDLEGYSLAPLWKSQEEALTNEPKIKARPHIWHWSDLRPKALRAAELVGTQDAERRVLMLLNQGLKGRIATTNSAAPQHGPDARRVRADSGRPYHGIAAEQIRGAIGPVGDAATGRTAGVT